MNPVVHFEMPYDDANRVSDFYSKTFGWKPNNLGESMGGYIITATTEIDENNTPMQPGRINGGFYPKKDNPNAPYPNLVIAVPNLKEAIDKIRANGGTIIGEPADIPGYGMYIAFTDTEGNRVALMEPKPGM